MNSCIRCIIALALLLGLAPLAGAGTVGGPATGLWYNPQESGRGYDIDIQGDTMIVATYIYDDMGVPIWYLSSGTYDHATGIFQSTYDSYSGGQCFGCDYTQPTVHQGAAGPITILFTTNQTAVLTYANGAGSTNIQKFNYGFANRTDTLLGEWAFTFNNLGTVDGDWIVFDEPYTDPNGVKYSKGYVVGNPDYTVLGRYVPEASEVQIQVQRGTTTQHLYRFGIFDDHRAIGLATVYENGAQTTPDPMTATGARLLFESELDSRIIGAQ